MGVHVLECMYDYIHVDVCVYVYECINEWMGRGVCVGVDACLCNFTD